MSFEIAPYDPSWPAMAEAAMAELCRALPGVFSAVEHVGSTSVPGLAAKPIVDLMAATADLARLREGVGRLEALGYERVEAGIPGRLFYRRAGSGRPDVHLHVVLEDSWSTRNERLLRDYLRQHPADARRYAALKRRLAASGAVDADYTRGKTALVQELTDSARAARGLPPVPVWEE